MPGGVPTGTSRAFALTIQGVNVTGRVPADAVTITETAGESNATMEFDLEYPSGGSSLAWLTGLAQDVELRDLTNSRRLFRGNLVNARRTHYGATGIAIHCTCVAYNAWLDRLVLPKWISKRPNGTNMTTDREMVQAVTAAVAATPAGQFAWDALNAYVSSTNASMPVVRVDQGGPVSDILGAIAEAAATAADPTARHFYVDFDNHLHYFKGNEGLTAPYRLGDASYTATVRGTSGLVSLWSMREASGAPAYDSQTYADLTLAGSYTRNVASGVINEPHMSAVTLDGTSGAGSTSGANLHPGDTFSLELWFKRSANGDRTLLYAGSGDYNLRFTAADKIALTIGGGADVWRSTATVTDTNWHHLVVTKAGATRAGYLDGVTLTNDGVANGTITASAETVYVGRWSGAGSFFAGSIQNVAIYNAALSAATALAHYNDGMTIVPDYFEFETEINDAGISAYVKGGNVVGTGWVTPTPLNASYRQTFLLDRPQSTSASLKTAIGTAFLKRDANEIYGGRAVITMPASTWRAGQTVTIDNASLGIDGSVTGISQTYEIKQLDTAPNLGSGVVTYDIYFGSLPWSGTFAIRRKRRSGASTGGSTSHT